MHSSKTRLELRVPSQYPRVDILTEVHPKKTVWSYPNDSVENDQPTPNKDLDTDDTSPTDPRH
jgi:hypothetical protein